jgi:hypothetical protein
LRERESAADHDHQEQFIAHFAESLPNFAVMLFYEEEAQMTQLEVAYRYHTPPTEATMRAFDNLREVYGVRRITFKEAERIIRVKFDASRFKEPVIAGLLKRTGLDLGEQLILA